VIYPGHKVDNKDIIIIIIVIIVNHFDTWLDISLSIFYGQCGYFSNLVFLHLKRDKSVNLVNLLGMLKFLNLFFHLVVINIPENICVNEQEGNVT
jgi:hypothetical protein